MKNPLDSVGTTVTLGVVFSVIVMLLPSTPGGDFSHLSLGRWLHIVTGIFWIGLLYYFNVAQIPALAAANADKGGPGGAGIVKYVAPRALLWFRWTAVATFLTGVWLLGGRFLDAFLFREGSVVLGIGVSDHALCDGNTFQVLDGATRLYSMPFSVGATERSTFWQLSFACAEEEAAQYRHDLPALRAAIDRRCGSWHALTRTP